MPTSALKIDTFRFEEPIPLVVRVHVGEKSRQKQADFISCRHSSSAIKSGYKYKAVCYTQDGFAFLEGPVTIILSDIL
jgi:hypothetical protein